jgi:hypothetical protein
MMLKKKPSITHEQALAARPLRSSDANIDLCDDGGAKLRAPMRPPRWGGWLFRMPENAKKTFELDSVGVFVWNCCDGKTSVKQIIHKLSKKYDLNLREAEVSSLAFLQTLAKKGLIGMQVEKTAHE